MSDRRVLVTGGTGFVGSRTLAPLLGLGFEVHAWTRGTALPMEPTGVHWHRCDLADASAVRRGLSEVRPTHVLHCAWTVEHGRFWEAPENRDCVRWSAALAAEAVDAGVRRFVGVGTCAEYDWADGSAADPRRESDPLRPTTLYGASKAESWRLLQDIGAAGGMGVAWARLFHLYGEGEHPSRLIPHLFAGLTDGHAVALGPGAHRRDFMAVEDLGGALAALVAGSVAGPVNIATGVEATVAELAEIVGRLAGRTDLLKPDALPPRASDVPLMLADVTRLRDEVGFTPALSLHEGLRRYFESWQRLRLAEVTS